MSILRMADRHLSDPTDQALDCLRRTSLFSNFTDVELIPFQRAAQIHNYKKDRIIYLQDDLAPFFYIICSGWVKLFHTLPEGDEIILDMLEANHMFGESAIFEHGHHTSSTQVVEDAKLLMIPYKVMKEQISLNPKLALNMLSSMSRHYRVHHGEMAFNTTLQAPQRIGHFLLKLCPTGKTNNISFNLPYAKTLIADTLGIQIATFSRALNTLRQVANVRINNTRVEIDSIDPLMRFVYGTASEDNSVMPLANLSVSQDTRLAVQYG